MSIHQVGSGAELVTGPAPLELRLFGPFEALRNGDPLPRLRTRKEYRLLALLALRHDRPTDRAWLAGTLGPESSETDALTNLRGSLKNIRRAFGEAGSRSGQQRAHGEQSPSTRLYAPAPRTLSLNLRDASVDVLAFDALIAQGDGASLARAAALYRGPLLEGWWEEWALEARALREQAYLEALEGLATVAQRTEQWEEAERWLRMALAVDPLRETAHRALMTTLAVSGRCSAAVEVYRDLRLLLQRELRAEPAPETSALFHELRAAARAKALGGRKPEESRRSASPLTSFLAPARRLPRPLTRFVGREHEIREITAALTSVRLLTLTGAGGVGKTRLAIQVAEEVSDDYRDGVTFVELGALTDPALVVSAAVAALGIPEQAECSLLDALLNDLCSKQHLLVLDNCEHLREACAHLVEALLPDCAGLTILATSREPLHVDGELCRRVPSLAYPEAGQWLADDEVGFSDSDYASELLQYDAIRLFVERASARAPFMLTDRNARPVAALCRALDGIPLAIELAAARVHAMPAETILERLDGRFRLLTRGRPTALPRHQTLQACIDWSHDLLSASEQALLRRLSVFVDGWTLEAAEAVCGDAEGRRQKAEGSPDGGEGGTPKADGRRQEAEDPTEGLSLPTAYCLLPSDVLDLLTSLIDKSLVEYDATVGGGRYRLLETVRQYESDRLLASGEGEALRERHRDWFLGLAERATLGQRGREQVAWYDRLEMELANVRAAMAQAATRPEGIDAGLRAARVLWRFWFMRDHWSDWRELTASLLARVDATTSPELRANALVAAGWLAHEKGDRERAIPLLTESLALFRSLADEAMVAEALFRLAVAVFAKDVDAACVMYQESLGIRRRMGDIGGSALSLCWLGKAALRRRQWEVAVPLFEESVTLFREVGDIWGIAFALVNLSRALRALGVCERATALTEESLALARQLGFKNGIATSLNERGEIARSQGHWSEAEARFRESLALFRGWPTRRILGYQNTIQVCLHALQGVAVSRGASPRGAQLFGAAAAIRETHRVPQFPLQRDECERDLAALRTALGPAAYETAWNEGRRLTLEQAISLALE